jgi:aminoglycoside phosphotransferase (APT) family kinase protein
LVLRLIDNVKWLAESPDIARQEAEGLCRAAESGLRVPKLIGFDERGRQCGVPAVLMSKLSGRVELEDLGSDARLGQLAEALATIHAVDPAGFGWDYDPWYDIGKAHPPSWTRCPDEWERAIVFLAGGSPGGERRFLHRDYHPTNVLWESGVISGIVDWPNACVGPRGADVAHCRWNLAALYGPDVADRFLKLYGSQSESVFRHDLYWDLSSLIEVSGGAQLYPPWVTFGVDLTEEIVRQRNDEYLLSIMAQLSA